MQHDREKKALLYTKIITPGYVAQKIVVAQKFVTARYTSARALSSSIGTSYYYGTKSKTEPEARVPSMYVGSAPGPRSITEFRVKILL